MNKLDSMFQQSKIQASSAVLTTSTAADMSTSPPEPTVGGKVEPRAKSLQVGWSGVAYTSVADLLRQLNRVGWPVCQFLLVSHKLINVTRLWLERSRTAFKFHMTKCRVAWQCLDNSNNAQNELISFFRRDCDYICSIQHSSMSHITKASHRILQYKFLTC